MKVGGHIGDAVGLFNLPPYALGPELVVDGNFSAACGVNWTCNAPWTIAGGIASIDGSQVAAVNLFQANSIAQYRHYLMAITLQNVTAGSMHFASGVTVGTSLDADGFFQDIIYQDQVTGGNIIMQADANFAGEIKTVSVRQILWLRR